MAREKTMGELSDILQRLRQGHEIRKIQRETGIHRKVIRKLQKEARGNGWLRAGCPLPDEKALYEAYYGTAISKTHPLDTFKDKIKAHLDEQINVTAIHTALRKEYGGSLSQLYRYIQKHFPSFGRQAIMREKELSVMEVDFGHLGLVYDPETKRNRKVKVFSIRLRWSRHAYRQLVYDEKQSTFFSCHGRAFGFFNGVPKRIVLDNTKAAVIQAALYDPVINRGYYDLAKHYGFLIDPCRPRSPQLKGGIESDIKYIKGSFWKPFMAERKIKGLGFPAMEEAVAALKKWECEVAMVRVIHCEGKTVEELFLEEQEKLLPLPAEPYETVTWQPCTVYKGFVRYETSAYSVCEGFSGKKVIIAAGNGKMRVFHQYELIAEHILSKKRYQQVILPAHESIRLRLYQDMDRKRLIERASLIGPATKSVIEKILDDNVIYGIRPAYGMLKLAHSYTQSRLEAACQRALAYEIPRYRNIKAILEKGLDKKAIEDAIDSRGQYHFTFARGKGYFEE